MFRTLATGVAAAVLLGCGTAQAGEPAGDAVLLAGGQCPSVPERPCPADRPPHAEPGKCYAKVRNPARFETYTETVVISPPRREARVIPPLYETVNQRVLVSAERVERYTVPATYRTVVETVVDRPGGVRIEHSEAVYETRWDTVMVRPARTEWRRQYVGPGGLIPARGWTQPTGEVMCLVEIPAEFSRVERRVLVQPARSYEVAVPPVLRQVTRQVVDEPARVVERVVPAVWRHEQVRRMVEPGRTEYIDIPPVTRVETRERQIAPGGEEWRVIECPPGHAPPHHGAPPPPPLAGERPGPPPYGERG